MKVFEVVPDFTFQSFHTSDPESQEFCEVVYSRELGRCEPILPGWRPLRLFEESAKLKNGNFARSWGGGFVIDDYARNALGTLLEGKCEFLPLLPHKGEVFHVMNLLRCVDCLDETRTTRLVLKETGQMLTQIEKYYFVPERVPESILFRLPKRSAVFTATGLSNPESEFKTVVEHKSLTGLKFKELWSDSD